MAALLPLFRQATRTASPPSDRELLDRFAAGRDEDAFAELVRRHGPVVYRVCRRLIGPDGADDAFQASFLVLATRLDAARAANSLGGWLVGVAGRVAWQMRRAVLRRKRREAIAVETRPTEWSEEAADLADQFRVLDEELARLPDRLRDPVVLCLLQGRTQEQAALELGRDARTLRRRLERAKQVLRARLERRGVVPAVASALVTGAGSVSATVPRALEARTVATVFDFLTGGAGAARSAPVVLAKGVATTMLARKVMHLMAAAAAGLVGFGVVLAGDSDPLPVPRTPPPTQAKPLPMPVPTPPAMVSLPKPRAAVPQAGDRQFLIEGLCVQVPGDFCEQAGLEDDATSWTFSKRETRMFNSLIRAEVGKGGAEVNSRPQLIVADNQTGFAQVGYKVPFAVSEELKMEDGKLVKISKTEEHHVGKTIKATPTITTDSKLVQLRVEMQNAEMSESPVDLGNGLKAPAFNIQSLSATVALPDGGTAVLRAGTSKKGGVKRELLWVLTVHVLKEAKAVAPIAQPKPQGIVVMPPLPLTPQPTPLLKPMTGPMPPPLPRP